MQRILTVMSLGLVVSFLSIPGALASSHGDGSDVEAAARKPWNAGEVEQLAAGIGAKATKLRDEMRARPKDPVGAGTEPARKRYMDHLRRVEAASRKLANAAKDGKTADDTFTSFQRIDELQRDTAEEARRLFLPKETIDDLQDSRKLVEELRVFYTGEKDTRPGLVGPRRSENPAHQNSPE